MVSLGSTNPGKGSLLNKELHLDSPIFFPELFPNYTAPNPLQKSLLDFRVQKAMHLHGPQPSASEELT